MNGPTIALACALNINWEIIKLFYFIDNWWGLKSYLFIFWIICLIHSNLLNMSCFNIIRKILKDVINLLAESIIGPRCSWEGIFNY